MHLSRLTNPYDSHVHWEATGSLLSDLDLSQIKSPYELTTLPKHDSYKRGEWIVGYGWDESKWLAPDKFHRSILDRWGGLEIPMLLERADRHAAIVSTEALKRAGYYQKHQSSEIPGGVIELDETGWPTGVVVDRAMDEVKKHLPPKSHSQVKSNLLSGCQVFNQSGFTHIRDLTCNETQFAAALEIFEEGKLTLAIEQFFDCHSSHQLPAVIRLVTFAKKQAPSLLRVKGIKLFYDGSLGSEGALISRPYYGCSANQGFRLYEPRELEDMIAGIWSAGHEVAVHAIGDQGAHEVAEAAQRASKKTKPQTLHIEHAQMLRPDTIQILKKLDVICHMQPCHWLTDRAWTDKKLGPLVQYLFRWRQLEEEGVRFDFGSDAPIEISSFSSTLEAIEDSARAGIPSPKEDIERYMQHSDIEWVQDCYCEFSSSVTKTCFQGKTVFQS